MSLVKFHSRSVTLLTVPENEPEVALGEADAGIVYATDVIAAGDTVSAVAIPNGSNVDAEYPIAVTADGPNPDAARAFVEFVLGPTGQAILEVHGFTAP